MNLKIAELPAILRSMMKVAGLKQRKALVLAMKKGQAINDGSIVGVLEGHSVEQVPYHEGGGYRSSSPIIVVKGFDGGCYIGLPALTGYRFDTVSMIAVACDAALEVA